MKDDKHKKYKEVIKMVEEKRNSLRKIVIKKGIFATKDEKRCLEQYEDILLHLYEKYAEYDYLE